uniref:Uncharacterized protein n=1 Tax=Myotis myotis TaxID=51298 RepID=A0A7J7Z716_MYOMY|nr:hypothetical protein mMyoMyo1_010810 [Myotis myotis]
MGVRSGLPGRPHTHLPGMTGAAAPPPGKVAGTGEQGGRKDRPAVAVVDPAVASTGSGTRRASPTSCRDARGAGWAEGPGSQAGAAAVGRRGGRSPLWPQRGTRWPVTVAEGCPLRWQVKAVKMPVEQTCWRRSRGASPGGGGFTLWLAASGPSRPRGLSSVQAGEPTDTASTPDASTSPSGRPQDAELLGGCAAGRKRVRGPDRLSGR